jgi:rRNA maturation RNase YbeY
LKVRIFYDNIDFRLKGWRKIKKVIEKVISEEGKISGDLNFIITDDNSLKKINAKYLKHNYFTDVISFDNNTDGKISGEVYISFDRVKINSVNYNVSLREEFMRVIVHGVLHLCGHRDNDKQTKSEMTRREDYWLSVYYSL